MPHKIFTRSSYPKELANRAAQFIDDPMRAENRGVIRPFIAGGIQGIGDYISGMQEPEGMVGIGAAPINTPMLRMGGLRGIGRAITESEPAIRDEAGRLLVPERMVQRRPPGPWDANIAAPREQPINPEDIMMQKIRERFNMGQPLPNDPTLVRRR